MGCARIDSLVRRPLERLSLVRRRHHCRASAWNLDLSLALTWLLSRGSFFIVPKPTAVSTSQPTDPWLNLLLYYRTLGEETCDVWQQLYYIWHGPGTRFELSISRSRNWASAISTLWWIPKLSSQKLSDQSQFVFSAGTCSPDQNK